MVKLLTFASTTNDSVINYQFLGEYECRLDAKGRLKLPAAIVRRLGGDVNLKFTVNRGFEKHLMLYPNDVWEQKTKEINQLNIYSTQERQVIRYFYRGATEVEMDSVERINLPASLLAYAEIEQDVILSAYQNHIEIWSKQKYQQMLEDEPEDFASIADLIVKKGEGDSGFKS